jgi:hypothetical protein
MASSHSQHLGGSENRDNTQYPKVWDDWVALGLRSWSDKEAPKHWKSLAFINEGGLDLANH